jgi:hypothetical protein
MHISERPLPTIAPSEARRARRIELAFRASIREPGTTRFEISIKDISVTGFRFASSFSLRPGAKVWLTIPGLAPLEASVVWARNFTYGCAFFQPLHAAVLDHVTKQIAIAERG